MSAGAVLATEGLSKRFGDFTAVRDLSLTVRPGDIYGFLGLNGAGKTTTIRMALGLIRPSAGRALLFGRDPREAHLEVMRRVGALVEVPAFYPYLTGRQNLEILARLYGADAVGRIDGVLEEVGLGDRGHSAVRTYSQGMRQRLGIAQALLNQPELVILDEPTNGLDPQGIQEIRALLQRLNRERGTTLFLSSHLLYEVELLCNRVAILREGALVEETDVAAILARTTGAVRLRARPEAEARAVLGRLDWARPRDGAPPGCLLVESPPDRLGELNRLLVDAGVEVSELAPERVTLEEYFLAAGTGP